MENFFYNEIKNLIANSKIFSIKEAKKKTEKKWLK